MKTVVAELMNARIYSVPREERLVDAVEIMRQNNIGALLVMEGDHLEGIFTERDLLKKINLKAPQEILYLKIQDVMTPDIKGVDHQEPYTNVIHLMRHHRIRHTPVFKDHQVVGMVSLRDLLDHHEEYLQQLLEENNQKLLDTIVKIQESEEYFRTIFAHSAVAITVVDKNETIVDCNQFLSALLGMKKEELLHKPVWILYPKEEWQRLRALKIREMGLIHHLETKMLNKQGEPIDVDISISVLREPSGEISHSIGIIRDIRERKGVENDLRRYRTRLEDLVEQQTNQLSQSHQVLRQEIELREKAEVALKESEEKYRNIVESMHEVIMLSRPDGEVLYVSPSCRDLLGFDPETLVGTREDFTQKAEPQRVSEIKQKVLAGENVEQIEHQVLTKAGQTLWVSRSWRAILSDGAPRMVISVLRDVTERRRIEDELRNAYRDLIRNERALRNMFQDLRRAHVDLKDAQNNLIRMEKMSAVGLLASGVAHEVKNPLGVIIQGINYLTQVMPEPTTEVKEVLEMMRGSVKRADNIVRGLVDFSKKNKAEMTLQNLNDLLESSLKLITHEINKETINIIKDYQPDLPKVFADVGNIEQVFINLLINATHAMPSGGTITLRTMVSRIDKQGYRIGQRTNDFFSLGEETVTVEIQDTGSGISPEHITRVFDPFFTTKGPREGAGLGLAVTKNIMEMHNALIDVESEVGKGTKFILRFRKVDDATCEQAT